jgi:hypothetical protein
MASHSRAPISGFLGDEFNGFLFAPIGIEQHGRALTVLSLLARLDLDPWAQAAGFARMSRKTAIGQLAEMIADLPERTMMSETPNVAALRLVGLLPASGSPKRVRLSPWQRIKQKWRAVFVGMG